MSGVAEMVAWLRREIETDKTKAQAVTQGMAWCTKDVEGDELWDFSFIAIYTDGWPWRETARCCLENEADHIARHDPQDVIARCDAELAILDEHEDIDGHCETCGNYDPTGLHEHSVAAPCRTVRLLAQGYRHRDGWRGEWAT